MTLRVIQWATGKVGNSALQAIIKDPELELVGVRVYSEDKEGRDAGDLCGLPPTGVLATRDADALLALRPDCVVCSALELEGIDPVVDEMARILASGTNIVSSSLTGFVFPLSIPMLYGDAGEQLEKACEEGRSTIYFGGINPGLMCDVLPAMLASGCRDIESIVVTETYDDMQQIDDPELLQQAIGFGLTLEDDEPAAEFRMIVLDMYWSSTMKLLAHALQVELDEIRPFRNVYVADDTVELPGLTCEKGTIAALHAGFHGIVDGKTRITLNVYARGAPRVAADLWPAAPGGGGYRLEINGTPSLFVEVALGGGDPGQMATVWAGNRLVSAIPDVCAAEPGLSSFLTLGQVIRARPNWN